MKEASNRNQIPLLGFIIFGKNDYRYELPMSEDDVLIDALPLQLSHAGLGHRPA